MKKGKLIVIDGIDNSGKATQALLLANGLRKLGKRVKNIDFPRYYDNFFGGFIGECLVGKHGNFLSLDPHIASVLYAADRFESSEKIKQWLSQGYVVIADRYVSANQIHQGGKITDSRKRKKFLAWIEKVEYAVFKIPRPDVIVYLDVPLEISLKLSVKNNNRRKKKYLSGNEDVHENSVEHLQKAKLSAIGMIKENNKWIRIECAKNGGMMTKEEISDTIMKKLKSIIK